jgi:hypothetical protein
MVNADRTPQPSPQGPAVFRPSKEQANSAPLAGKRCRAAGREWLGVQGVG